MDVAHVELDDPRWSEALARLPHDFYHRPEYVGLDADWNHARPMAFLARAGEAERVQTEEFDTERPDVADLMAALARSVEEARQRVTEREGTSGPLSRPGTG